jgi:hypothetical protein
LVSEKSDIAGDVTGIGGRRQGLSRTPTLNTRFGQAWRIGAACWKNRETLLMADAGSAPRVTCSPLGKVDDRIRQPAP